MPISSMKKVFRATLLLFFLLLAVPSFAFAFHKPGHNFYVTCGFDANDPLVKQGLVDAECTFKSVIDITVSIINGWIGAIVIVATLVFAYAGYLYITAAGSEEKIKHAHSIFTKTALGFAFVLGAWLIAYTFERVFLCDAEDVVAGRGGCKEDAVIRSFLKE